jgi:hypothetical protein
MRYSQTEEEPQMSQPAAPRRGRRVLGRSFSAPYCSNKSELERLPDLGFRGDTSAPLFSFYFIFVVKGWYSRRPL